MSASSRQNALGIDSRDASGLEPVGADKTNGAPLAALLSAGIGVFVLGALTALAEANADLKALMDLDKNMGLGVGVGPLSGKTTYAVVAWLVAWGISALFMRGKRYTPRPFYIAMFALIAGGFLLTFPPIFDLF